MLIVNSSQFLSMSFAYIATPSSRESLQLFGIAMFRRKGSVISVGIVVWYAFVMYIYRLVRVRRLVRV